MKGLSKKELIGKFFVGEVVDNNDPEREGRCKIKVLGMFSGIDIPDEAIPWAQPFNRKMFAGGGNGGYADISVPKIGTYVRVQFAEGDMMAPEYTSIQTVSPEVKAEIEGSYLNSHVLAYDVDEQVKIFYTPSKGLVVHHKDSQIIINPDSSITIEHSGGDSIIELIGTTINIVAQSTVNITAPQAIIDANSIELGAGATEAVIKGNAFRGFFNLHTHPAPNTPPSVQMPTALLSKTTKTK